MFVPSDQYIQNALKNGLPDDAERFFRIKFDNASEDHVSSLRGTLSRQEMIELKARVDEIVQGYNELTQGSIMTKEQRDLSKVMYIYNYLLENVMYTQCQFAPNSSNVFGGQPYKNSIYGALVLHDAVCSGISEAFDCLCKVMDVESKKLLSTPSDPWGGGHAFNIVKIGEIWYQLDATLEIGVNPGHKIRGGKWKDRNFLTPFTENQRCACVPAVPDCLYLYSRENIEQMKRRLENRGLSFEYQKPQQIIHNNLHDALHSFLIKRIGGVNVETAQNFEHAIEGTFNILKRNGTEVEQKHEPIQYIEEDNKLFVINNHDGVELYSNGDSRFVIKSINENQITSFNILSRNGEIESRLPVTRWNPIDYSNAQEDTRNNYEGDELNSNGDPRFVIKSKNETPKTGFTILRRNDEIESELPAIRWNPINCNNPQEDNNNNHGRRK